MKDKLEEVVKLLKELETLNITEEEVIGIIEPMMEETTCPIYEVQVILSAMKSIQRKREEKKWILFEEEIQKRKEKELQMRKELNKPKAPVNIKYANIAYKLLARYEAVGIDYMAFASEKYKVIFMLSIREPMMKITAATNDKVFKDKILKELGKEYEKYFWGVPVDYDYDNMDPNKIMGIRIDSYALPYTVEYLEIDEETTEEVFKITKEKESK